MTNQRQAVPGNGGTDADGPEPAAHSRLRGWLGGAALAVLPLLLILGFYYRPYVLGTATLPTGWDHDFYIYQTHRMGELGGRWWELGNDPLIGRPFPTAAAKHPGLYEGADVLLVSSLTARSLDPPTNYHLLIVLVLVTNGWVASWVVFRLTGSYGWAALGVVLVTLNAPTDIRVAGHFSLFKYSWVLLTVWAFYRYLDSPSRRTGLLLGLAAVLLLQGSLYLAYLLAVSLTVWWLGCLLAGRLDRRHLKAAASAAVVFFVLGAVLTYPVWRPSTRELAGSYYKRELGHVYLYSADLWQYCCSHAWGFVKRLGSGLGENYLEGWNYAGFVLLTAIGLYAVARLRRWEFGEASTRFLDRSMGISLLLVVLSLRGGPGLLLYLGVPSFRCYGRAGILAVLLWSVAAPVVLHGLAQKLPRRRLRATMLVAALAVALYEGDTHSRLLFSEYRTQNPAWVSWLAGQPPEVRAALLPLEYKYDPKDASEDSYSSNWGDLYYRLHHKHATLNGCELTRLRAGLQARGASVDAPNEAGLRYIASLGYHTLVVREDYFRAHPWIDKLSWLERGPVLEDWKLPRRVQTGFPGASAGTEFKPVRRDWHVYRVKPESQTPTPK